MQKNMFIQILAYILVVAVLLACVGWLIFLTDWFQHEPTKYFIKVGQQVYLSNGAIVSNGDVKMTVHKSINVLAKDIDYSVKIIPKVDDSTDFSFCVDEYTILEYSSIDDLTSAFDIFKDQNAFVIEAPNSLDFVLEKYYGKDVVLPELEERVFFTVVITVDGVVFNIDLRFDDVYVAPEDITVTPPEVVF